MEIRTFRSDDPELAQHLAANAARLPIEGNLPPPPYSPKFSDYVAGKTETKETPKIMERAKKDEVMDLPDGRQIQIQAKGAPVNEALAERERQLVANAKAQADVDPLNEITEGAIHAIGTGVKDTTTVRPLAGGELGHEVGKTKGK